MFRVGLTGNIASGKSSVARIWREAGATVVDADTLAREAVEPGSPALERIREAFGDEVMDGDALDRDAMRERVFSDPEARDRLEAIVHPEVARLRDREETRLRERGVDIVVQDIPLLFEVGLEDEFDMIVLVDAPRQVRLQRLVRDRGLDREQARAMVNAQMSAAVKRGRADVVIENDGSLDELGGAARRVWQEVRRRAGAREDPSYGWIHLDMHVHTHSSYDCRMEPEAVLERAEDVGLHRICVTDHNEIHVAVGLAERYPDRVVPGEEVRTAEGVDIIGLYVREWIPKGTPARETCQRIREQGGLVYVPHPFGRKGAGGVILSEIEDLVDIVEGFNARVHKPALNQRADQWARARGLPVGAGSDAHTPGEIGAGYVRLPAFNNDASSLRAALAKGTIHGSESSRLVHLASAFARLVP